MQVTEAILMALRAAWSHKLRSFFTLLGVIVSVGFLVAVVAVIQGMNAYVRWHAAVSQSRDHRTRLYDVERPAFLRSSFKRRYRSVL